MSLPIYPGNNRFLTGGHKSVTHGQKIGPLPNWEEEGGGGGGVMQSREILKFYHFQQFGPQYRYRSVSYIETLSSRTWRYINRPISIY